MNKATEDYSVEEALREELLELLGEVSWLSVSSTGGLHWGSGHRWEEGQTWGFMVSVQSGQSTYRLAVEDKARLEPRQFQELARRLPPVPDASIIRVLGVPHITPRMAELCQEEGWGWYDLAGNCHFDLPGLLYIERTGAKAPRPAKVREANLSSPEAARVVRALLAPQNAGRRWLQREMVSHFEETPGDIPSPSLALVNKIVRYLAAQAMVEAFTRGFQVVDPRALLQLWTRAYAWDRQVKRRYFTLLRDGELARRLQGLVSAVLTEVPYALAVFSAANLQAPYVRQPRTWLYVPAAREAELVQLLEAKPVDSGDNLVVLIPDDPGVFYGLQEWQGLLCTNPVQTYVDLRYAGGRGEEAAEALWLQRLAPEWERSS